MPFCLRHPDSIRLITAAIYILRPRRLIVADALGDIPSVFRRIEAALDEGFHVAGYLAYEAGYHFVEMDIKDSECQPLAWFGVYDNPRIFDHRSGTLLGAHDEFPTDGKPSQCLLGPERDIGVPTIALGISEQNYVEKIRQIQDFIAQGETYQVNFTDEMELSKPVAPLLLYSALLTQQPVPYSGFMNIADQRVLSFSPELFFRIANGAIITRPMKGTMPRGRDTKEDEQLAERLRQDEKNRAEHVMIVDLLRNDLGRICAPGTVRVENPFSIERYETLHQMTSTVSGTLRPRTRYYEIFQSLFPCGSVTGAQKIRTMQIIRDLERKSRSLYSGAIGFFSPAGTAIFSVAIRTLVLKNGSGRMGVGGGIVADSNPHDEYRECLLKASFLRQNQSFELIETLLWQRRYHLIEYHLDRLQSSAQYFGFRFDREAIASRMDHLSNGFDPGTSYRVRLLLDISGRVTHQSTQLGAGLTYGRVRMARERTASTDVYRLHKTTNRSIYERNYVQAQESGFDDVVFMNERDEVTEGAVNNLFIVKREQWSTPPIECGVLPGVFRRHVLETQSGAKEQLLRLADLTAADAIYICNAVRGLRQVQLHDGDDKFGAQKI